MLSRCPLPFRLANPPKGKLWNFLQNTSFIINNIVSEHPLMNAPNYFIDGNKAGWAAIIGPNLQKKKNKSPYQSVQKQNYLHYIVYYSNRNPIECFN